MADSTEDSFNRAFGPGRLKLLIIVVLLVAAGVAARKLWDSLDGKLADSPHYQISADIVHLSPGKPPRWIRTDVKAEVLRDSGIIDSLTLLDPPVKIQQRLIDAFELHPWIRSVERVDLVGPQNIKVSVLYREPVAVVEVESAGQQEWLPVDATAVRLPSGELTDTEMAYLPRIAGIQDRPLEGEAWSDSRMQGAAELAARLRPQWEHLSLLEIIPSDYPEIQRSNRYYVYEIRASGGTLIRWGAAPNFGPPAESTFEQKLSRLTRYVEQHGSLESINSPKSIDVRDSLQDEERLAREPASGDSVR